MAVDPHAPTVAQSSESMAIGQALKDHDLRLRALENKHSEILGGLRILQWLIGLGVACVLACTGWLVIAHRDALDEINNATTAIAAGAAAKQVREEAVNEKIRDHAQRIYWLESARLGDD